jgi:hypothetical protein
MSDNEEVWRQALAAVTAENHALRAQNAYLAPRQRAGQLVANAMYAVDPVFYEAHRGDFTDPFNNDGRIEAYLRAWREASVAEIERLDGAMTMILQDEKQDSKDLARLHAMVTCGPQAADAHNHTACVAAEIERMRGNALYAEHLALVDRKFTGEFGDADQSRLSEVRADIDRMEALQRIDALVAENDRLRLIAAQHDGLVEERNHYRERARTLGMRFDWAQHVAATAMREGLATCESLRDAACLADDLRELAERHHDDAMDRLQRADAENVRLRSEAVVVEIFNEEQAIAIAQSTVLAGRRRAPSRDEIEAHSATGGRWRAQLSHGGIYLARRPDAAILEHVGATWWAIDGDDNECAWPVLRQADQNGGVKV